MQGARALAPPALPAYPPHTPPLPVPTSLSTMTVRLGEYTCTEAGRPHQAEFSAAVKTAERSLRS